MHIAEGILSGTLLFSGAGLAAVCTSIGLAKLEGKNMARAAILSAAFFVASLIHVPVGPANVHLVLNGIVGLLLGWAAFPVILVAVILQAVMFQFGGITVIGVNTVNMALPAVVCFLLFGRLVRSERRSIFMPALFVCGALAVFGAALMVALSLAFSGQSFAAAAKVIVWVHLPLMVVEGCLTLFCGLFLKKVMPEIFYRS